MLSFLRFLLSGFILFFLVNCGGGSSSSSSATLPSVPFFDITLEGYSADEGIFDPSSTVDGSDNLWMSYSVVNHSAVDPVLDYVSTRIASSSDGGLVWTDAGVTPNTTSDFTIPDPNGAPGDTMNATWRYEVSKLIYDPNDADANRRWKILWHRILAVVVTVNMVGTDVPFFEHSWIGLSTALSPTGPWSNEQNLFVGSLYNSADDVTSGTPLFDLPTLFPGPNELENCLALTEPGALVKSDGIYIAMKCGHDTLGKIFLMKCDSTFTSCDYFGDFLVDSEANPFSTGSQNFNGFTAPELITVGNTDYLMVTPTETDARMYRGCLVFEVDSLANATVIRDNGNPVLVRRIDGEEGSFNGACAYHTALTNSGVLLSQHQDTSPHFHIQATERFLP